MLEEDFYFEDTADKSPKWFHFAPFSEFVTHFLSLLPISFRLVSIHPSINTGGGEQESGKSVAGAAHNPL